MIGRVFDLLTVKSYLRHDPDQGHLWLCSCICGKDKITAEVKLTQRSCRDCGCRRKESIRRANTKHGHKKRSGSSGTYNSWKAMNHRCTDTSYYRYADYGGRGIKVCDRWSKELGSFENFLKDLGERPPKHTLDRIDNNKDYCPENCRWATGKEQGRNKRSSHFITFLGQTKCISGWAESLGMKYATISSRLQRGWPTDRVLSPPKRI